MAFEKENSSAVDLWKQVFSTMAKKENASHVNPNYDFSVHEPGFRQAMKEAGWSEQEIEERVKSLHENDPNVPVTSPGVNPGAEAFFHRYSTEVEATMERLGLASHIHVARGVEPRLGPHAAKIGVVMTNESIVSVARICFVFAGSLLARSYELSVSTRFFGKRRIGISGMPESIY